MRSLRHCKACGNRPPITLERCPRCGADLEDHPLTSDPVRARLLFLAAGLAVGGGLLLWWLLQG